MRTTPAVGIWPALLRGALFAAVVVPVLARGGYLPASRVLFVFLAAAALLAAVACDPDAARRIAASPAVLLLIGLSALGALSATWSIVPASETLRWAAVVTGYAAVAIAAGVEVAVSGRVRFLAAGLAALAAVVGLSGLYGAAMFTEPFADRIGGTWRAGGTLEYPPALGLLEVSALPILVVGMTRKSRPALSILAAATAAVAGASLGLTGSRTQTFLAACVLGAAVVWPQRTVRAPRSLVAAACALIAGAAVAATVVADGQASARTAASSGRLVGLLGIVLLAAAAWAVVRRSYAALRERSHPRLRRGIAALALLLLAAPATLAAFASAGDPRSTDFTHGRVEQWDDAARTAWERPLVGTGADSFFAATERYQDTAPTRFAHNLPLELSVELGVVGLALTLALYAAGARAVWAARASWAGWLLAPAVLAFLATNLIDWPWHLAGSGAVWAAALGGLIAAGALARAPTRRRPS